MAIVARQMAKHTKTQGKVQPMVKNKDFNPCTGCEYGCCPPWSGTVRVSVPDFNCPPELAMGHALLVAGVLFVDQPTATA